MSHKPRKIFVPSPGQKKTTIKTLPRQNANPLQVFSPCILPVLPDILLVWMCTHLQERKHIVRIVSWSQTEHCNKTESPHLKCWQYFKRIPG